MSRAGGKLITRNSGAATFNNIARRGSSPLISGTADRTASPSEDELERKYAPPADASVDPELATTDYATDASFAERDARTPETSQSVPAAGRAADANAHDYDDLGKHRAGAPVDEGTRLQLREERLRVDKARFDRGVATVGNDIVTENQDVDVPFVREELFVERRPANGATVSSTPEMGAGDAIRVPLSEERVTVNKVPVITEEVVVGKRQVEDTQHISETLRKEKLNVADVDATTVGSGGERRDWQS